LRILFLGIGVFDKGGISRYCRYQIRALRELAGAENVVVMSLFPPRPNDFEEPFQVDYHGRGIGLSSEGSYLAQGANRAFAMRPAIVWSSHVRLLPAAWTARMAAIGGRLVANVYGRELWSRGQWAYRRLLSGADAVVSDSHFSRNFVVDQYGVKPERVRVIWDCVDLSRFHPQQRRTDLLEQFGIPSGPDFRYLLTLGRMEQVTSYKGYDRLLDALATFKENPNVIGIFAGDGDDRERLQRRAREMGLERKAFFIGSVQEATLPDVYNLGDMFSLVSERGHGKGEGVPLTPLEAAACGKPIVVGNEDGSQEAVIDGENGRIISPRDPGAMRDAIARILLDDENRRRMGLAARARVEAEFSYEGFRNKTGRLLNDLMKRGQRTEVEKIG
jgi:phosphatidylinositol alpha-1,6-mannosyltransferase